MSDLALGRVYYLGNLSADEPQSGHSICAISARFLVGPHAPYCDCCFAAQPKSSGAEMEITTFLGGLSLYLCTQAGVNFNILVRSRERAAVRAYYDYQNQAVSSGAQFCRADYWSAYITTYLSQQQLIVAPLSGGRIRHVDSAVEEAAQQELNIEVLENFDRFVARRLNQDMR